MEAIVLFPSLSDELHCQQDWTPHLGEWRLELPRVSGDSHWPHAYFCANVVRSVSKDSPSLSSALGKGGERGCSKCRSPAALGSALEGRERHLGSFALCRSTLPETYTPDWWYWPTSIHYPGPLGVPPCPIPNKGPAPMASAGVPVWEGYQDLCGHLLFLFAKTSL